jgi:hypothetical protein
MLEHICIWKKWQDLMPSFTILDHIPYSPNMVPSDFYHFPKLKQPHTGNHYMLGPWLSCRSGIKMHQFTVYCERLYETTAMLEKVCQPRRSLHGEITVMWWKMKFSEVTCFAFIEICIPISQKKLWGTILMHAHTRTHAHTHACMTTMVI